MAHYNEAMMSPRAIAGFWTLMALAGAFGQTRAKIGLVLEGGGALGFAHVGVLEWLEANHIPVDAVAGTSMGALVGGLYAVGKTPAEIQTIIDQIDWDQVLAGQAPFRELAYRRKEDRIAYPNRLEFGLKGGLNLPGGLNSGNEVSMVFDRNLLPYYDLKSFDDLPIPFRCVASELVSGKQKVFDSGSLPQALRATMSIPAVFAPIRIGDKIYTDGGALNNLPVDVAKNMGADIVIAVYLDTGPVDPKTLSSLVGIAGRNISMMVAANEVRSMAAADILLSADVSKFTSTEFTKADEILPKGREAAERKAMLLKRFALNDADWAAHMQARRDRRREQVPVPQYVAVSGVTGGNKRAVERNLEGLAGEPVNPAEIEARLTRLVGLGSFASFDYGIADGGTPGLRVLANEKRYGPPFLNLGLLIDGIDPTDIRFGMSGRLTLMNLGKFGTEWRSDFYFGANSGVTSEFYRPFSENNKWFVAPRVFASTGINDLYLRNNRLAQYRSHRSGLGADVGYLINRFSEVRFGEEVDWYSSKLRIGLPLVERSPFHAAITSVKYRYEGYDDPVVPRRGFRAYAATQWVSSQPGDNTRGYPQVDLRLAKFIPVSQKGSVFFTASGGTTFGRQELSFQSYSLGGPQLLNAYGRNE
ncbi:MAG: patatin-like phospholipase family protein, partial [Bryobacteraceae bacterium]